MIDELGVFRGHIFLGEDEFRTLCLVAVHSESASLCQLAFLTDAVVIGLFISQFEVVHRAAIGNALR